MESFASDTINNDPVFTPSPPDFLKIICILSFVCCGTMILIYSMGLLTLFLSEEMIDTIWAKILETQPQLENMDRFEFFHALGMSCLYNLVGNIFSLIGVIMMWRFNKIGFFIYAIAELAVNFFGIDVNTGGERSSGGLIFVMVIDLIFIGMYAANLKYMNREKNTNVA